MKTFLTALLILSAVVGFVFWNAWDLRQTLREMIELTDTLPAEASEFEKNASNEETIETLWQLWEREFPRIASTGGYSNSNRADGFAVRCARE